MASSFAKKQLLSAIRHSFAKVTAQQTRNMSKILEIDTPLIPLRESIRFMTDCLVSTGASPENAQIVAENLAAADYRGHYSHGMNRLELYVNDIIHGSCDGTVRPKILKEGPATAWLDARNGLGAVAGKIAMELAIQKAKEVGIGWVAVKGSNHYGIAGIYTDQARKAGLIGMSFTNTSPLMCPTRAKQSALGTNPLSLAAPADGDDYFFLDMATTAVAVGKIEIQRRKNQPLPEGWALNEEGKVETNADVAYKASRLMPLGGPEANSGYKGTGLGMLVEIFSGILAGASYGPHVRKWGEAGKLANLGHGFFALDPKRFAPCFEDRMSDLMDQIRGMEPADPDKPVLVAGDPEREHMSSVDENGGLRYVPDQMRTCAALAEKLKVRPMHPVKK